jgi:hypothetical protein
MVWMISQNSPGPSSQDFAITGLPDGKEKLAARRIPQGSAALTSCGEATALVAFAGLEIQATARQDSSADKQKLDDDPRAGKADCGGQRDEGSMRGPGTIDKAAVFRRREARRPLRWSILVPEVGVEPT